MWYNTIDEAMAALADAEQDVINDMGEDACEAGWYDIVHMVAGLCPPEVAAELIRRNL